MWNNDYMLTFCRWDKLNVKCIFIYKISFYKDILYLVDLIIFCHGSLWGLTILHVLILI